MLKKIKKFFSRKERDGAKIATRHEVKPRSIDRITGLGEFRRALADSDDFAQQVAVISGIDTSSSCGSGSSHSHHHSDSSCSSYDSGSSSSYDSGSSGGSWD